jgi:hypothetical protein
MLAFFTARPALKANSGEIFVEPGSKTVPELSGIAISLAYEWPQERRDHS